MFDSEHEISGGGEGERGKVEGNYIKIIFKKKKKKRYFG